MNVNKDIKLVSIIIPTYNSQEYIKKAIKSVFNFINGYEKYFEVIIVDDGSEDETKSILNKLQKTSIGSIEVIYNKHSGVSVSRNIGIKHACGKYLLFLDSDDCLSSINAKEIINDLLVITEEEKLPDMLWYDVAFSGIKNNNIQIELSNEREKLRLIENLIEINHDFIVHQGMAAKLYLRLTVEKNDIMYNPRLRMGEDLMFNMEFILLSSNVFLSSLHLYEVEQSHSMGLFKSENLNNEKYFRKYYLDLFGMCINENKDITNKIISKLGITGLIFLIRNYYLPLYQLQRIKIKEIKNQMETLINKGHYRNLNSPEFDNILRKSDVIIRKCISKKRYKTALLIAKYFN